MQRDAGQIQTIAKAVLTPLFRFAWRIAGPRASSTSRAPAARIIAPNHTSVLDSFFVPLVLQAPHHLRRQGRVPGRLEDQVPVPGDGHDPDRPLRRRRLAAGARRVRQGARVAASCSASTPRAPGRASGKLHKGHTGVARLALRTGSPDRPGRHRRLARRAAARRQGAPARSARSPSASASRSTSTRYADRANDRLVLRQITDELMYEIRNLSGQEYVDEYATKRHESIPSRARRSSDPSPDREPLVAVARRDRPRRRERRSTRRARGRRPTCSSSARSSTSST